MATVNIPSTVDDPNYRYKMPMVRCKVEGSGNGIKTNHMNMRDVALALKRNPNYVTKFLACELCVHGRYFDNEGKAIFQGVHSAEEISVKVDSFISSYVLCPECHLPEIDLYVENKLVMGKCNACGSRSKVNNVHRVAAYITKNPPEGSTVGGKQSKEEKKQAKESKAGVANKAVDKAGDGTKKKTVVKKKKIVKKVVRKKGDSADAFDLMSDTANTIMVRMNDLTFEKGSTPTEFLQELRAVQLTQALSTSDRFYLALGALFDVGTELEEDAEFNGEFKRISVANYERTLPYLCAIGYDCSKEAISALQKFMFNCVTEDSVKAHYPLVLKAFYDENIVDEEDITQFYEDDKEDEEFMAAKKALAPFLEWLEHDAVTSNSYEDSSEDESPVQKTRKLM